MRAGRSAERFGIFPYPAFRFEEVFQSSQRDRLTLHIADVLADLGNMAHDLHDVGARGRQRTHHQGAVEDEKNADNDGRYVGDLHKAVEKGVVLCHFIVQTEHYVPHAIIVAAELFLLVRLVCKRADQPHAADIFLNGEIDIAVRAAHVRENDFHRPCVADQRKDERGRNRHGNEPHPGADAGKENTRDDHYRHAVEKGNKHPRVHFLAVHHGHQFARIKARKRASVELHQLFIRIVAQVAFHAKPRALETYIFYIDKNKPQQ